MPKGKVKQRSDKQKEKAVKRALRRERIRRRYTEGDPEYQSLSKQLFSQGLKLKDVPGDGNCLFRALADQLAKEHVSHYSLRSDIAEYMRKCKEDFEPFMEEEGVSYEEYIADLMKDGTFGGNDTIVAFARLFNCTVTIHQPNEPRWDVHGCFGSKLHNQYHIAYLNGEHYCSVVPITSLKSLPEKLHQQVSKDVEKTTPHLSHSGTAGMSGMQENSLMTVMKATGCKDKQLAESILQENFFDIDMSIVELFQLMDIAGAPSTSTLLPPPLPVSGEVLKQKTAADDVPDEVRKQQKRTHFEQKHSQAHISNRERKETKKKQRKERRTNERKKEKQTEDTCEPIKSLAI